MVSLLSDIDYRKEISASINVAEIDRQLKSRGLLGEDTNRPTTSRTGVEFVLKNVEERGDEALADLVWCLEQTSDSHLGHQYAVDVLTNKEYDLETLADIGTASLLKRKYQKLSIKSKMAEGLDVVSLLPHLIQKGILTDKEIDELESGKITRKKKVIKLERILANKGPLAYLYFTQVLIESRGENCHLYQEIFDLIFDDT